MKAFLFLTFLISLAKSGLLIGIGILVKDHMDTVFSLIIRKPIPEGLISSDKLESLNKINKWMGIFIIIIGAGVALAALATITFGIGVSSHNFNFKF